MRSLTFLFISVVAVAFASGDSLAQDKNSWGEMFTCSVNWFDECAITNAETALNSEKPREQPVRPMSNIASLQQRSNLPEPVRKVLENPSPETARAYVMWSRQTNEKLTKATEYIAQATREMNSGASVEKSSTKAASGLGPVGLYYFFSPDDQSALKDVAVLNKIFQEGRLGVVGIPVRGNEEEIIQFLNDAKPLFPVRRSEAEVQMINPSETPELHLALPLEKKMLRLGSTITAATIAEAIGSIVTARTAPAQ